MLKSAWLLLGCPRRGLPFKNYVRPGSNLILVLHFENSISAKAAVGRASTHSESCWKGVVYMYVTYNDLFTFVLMIVAIITLVKSIYDKHKK